MINNSDPTMQSTRYPSFLKRPLRNEKMNHIGLNQVDTMSGTRAFISYLTVAIVLGCSNIESFMFAGQPSRQHHHQQTQSIQSSSSPMIRGGIITSTTAMYRNGPKLNSVLPIVFQNSTTHSFYNIRKDNEPTTTTTSHHETRATSFLQQGLPQHTSTGEIISSSKGMSNQYEEMTIYCDLDGVLVDFEYGVRQLFPDILTGDTNDRKNGHGDMCDAIQELKNKRLLWERIQSSDSAFFQNLPWAKGGQQLWNILQYCTTSTSQGTSSNRDDPIMHLNILTGVPPYVESKHEKFQWCLRELNTNNSRKMKHIDMAGPYRLHTSMHSNNNRKTFLHPKKKSKRNSSKVCNVITCWSEKKFHESRPGAVLIDDRIELKKAWESKGGIFIHHITGNLLHTIDQMIQHNVISNNMMMSDDKYILQQINEFMSSSSSINSNDIMVDSSTPIPRRNEALFRW